MVNISPSIISRNAHSIVREFQPKKLIKLGEPHTYKHTQGYEWGMGNGNGSGDKTKTFKLYAWISTVSHSLESLSIPPRLLVHERELGIASLPEVVVLDQGADRLVR